MVKVPYVLCAKVKERRKISQLNKRTVNIQLGKGWLKLKVSKLGRDKVFRGCMRHLFDMIQTLFNNYTIVNLTYLNNPKVVLVHNRSAFCAFKL